MRDKQNSNSEPGRQSPYAAFGEPAFRRFTLGMLIVQIGTGAQSAAILWELYARTSDPMMPAMVGMVLAVPMLLFTLPAGYLADVFDRRRIMMIGMVGTTLTSLALAVFSYYQGSIPIMLAILFLDATALRLIAPARTALVPLLVPAEKLENAMKWRSSLGQIAGMLGPTVGGLVMWLYLPATYLVCAGTTALFMLILPTIDIPDAARSEPGRMIAQVMEGVRFVWQKKVLLGTISLDLFAVLLGGVVYLLPIYVKDIIDLDGTGLSQEQAYGVLRAAPAAGAMLMALWLAHAPPIRKAGRTMLWAVAWFGVVTIIFGISENFWLSLAMLFLSGAFDNISVVVRHTLVQLLTPNEMRGRVSAVNAIFIGSSNEIGGFRAGVMATWIGAVASAVVGGVGTLVVVGAWAGLFPRLRKFGTLSSAVEESIDTSTPLRRPEEAADAAAQRR